MRNFITLSIAASIASAHLYNAEQVKYAEYLSKYGKSYGTIEEYVFRMERFMDADAQI